MANLQFNNNTCSLVDIWYESHKSLIISVCQELECLEQAKPLMEKLLDKPPSLKKLKDVNKPKRAKSAWVYFCLDKRPLVTKKNPGMSMCEISQELGKMWQKTSDKNKEMYEEQSEEDKQRYLTEMEEYQENMLQFS